MKLQQLLTSTSGTLGKQQLLKGIPYLEWKTFVFAYDPYFVYGIKFKNVDLDNLGEPTEFMFSILTDILSKVLTGQLAKHRVESFASINGDLIKLIVNKDLRCGVTATTFNKVHPKSIDQFKVQLAKEAPIASLAYPMLAQLKYDGVRLIVINDKGVVTFRTRNGKTIILRELKEVIERIPAKNYIIDGEITYSLGKSDDRTGISGAINSAMHGGTVDETDMVLHCFDFMTLSQWKEGDCADIYQYRYSILKELLTNLSNPYLELAITNVVHSAEAVNELYQAAIAIGYEGLILKHENHKYTFKRTKDWVKLKEAKTADLQCVAIQGGTGKYEDLTGALVCRGIVDGRSITVNVGSGLSDVQRALPGNHFLGSTIEVKYNATIQDKVTGKWSLFLPRFVRVRMDK